MVPVWPRSGPDDWADGDDGPLGAQRLAVSVGNQIFGVAILRVLPVNCTSGNE
jgi:hypothetical protein